jgi:hypothetical protein
MTAERFHAHGHPRVLLDHPCPHHVLEVRPMLPTLAAHEVHDLCIGGMVTVRAALDREAGALERRNVRGQAQTRGSRGRPATIEGGDAIIIERLYRPPERLSMQRLGCKHAGRQESSARCILEQSRSQVEVLVHTAEAVEDQRFDRMASGDEAHRRGVRGRVGHDFSAATCVNQAGDEAQMLQVLAAVAGLSIQEARRCWCGDAPGLRRTCKMTQS